LFFVCIPHPPRPPLFPYTTLFRSSSPPAGQLPAHLPVELAADHEGQRGQVEPGHEHEERAERAVELVHAAVEREVAVEAVGQREDRKSTRLNSSHSQISYAVFCLK